MAEPGVSMRTNAVSGEALASPSRVADWLELVKPRITSMVLVTTAIGLLLAADGRPALTTLLLTLLGTGMVAGGASALNHVAERRTDALMERTAGRPLPTGRLRPRQALRFALSLSLSGVLLLGLGVNLLTALLGAVSLLTYAFVYTPLKRRTALSTVIGAVPGALPPVMGWTAVRDQVDAGAVVLFGILFLWQLPHFLAIAWLCREDYRRAGFPMLPVVEPDGRSTARQAVLYGAALLPVSLLPSVLGLSGATYFVGALVLGAVFLGFCVAFSVSFSSRSARRLLLASVLYLPSVLLVMLVDSLL